MNLSEKWEKADVVRLLLLGLTLLLIISTIIFYFYYDEEETIHVNLFLALCCGTIASFTGLVLQIAYRLRVQKTKNMSEADFKARGIRELTRMQTIIIMTAMILTAIFACLTMMFVDNFRDGDMGKAITVLAPLFGILGAGLSALRSGYSKVTELNFIQAEARVYSTLIRLLIGATAGFFMVALVKSGLINIGEKEDYVVLTFAFISGFSEKFFMQMIDKAQEPLGQNTEKEKTE